LEKLDMVCVDTDLLAERPDDEARSVGPAVAAGSAGPEN
jgi:hypothetical protein